MIEIIIGSIVVLILLIAVGYWYFGFGSEAPASVDPAPVSVAPAAPSPPTITYKTAVAATPETAGSPVLPGTTIISAPGGTLTQYGQETPVSASEDEHFQPYMSILTNDMYRSDAAFDDPLGKDEPEIYGNYN